MDVAYAPSIRRRLSYLLACHSVEERTKRFRLAAYETLNIS